MTRPNPQDGFTPADAAAHEFTAEQEDAILDAHEADGGDFPLDDCWEDDDYEDDGQPTMYEEYQDLYGGDDWDHGQYDDY